MEKNWLCDRVEMEGFEHFHTASNLSNRDFDSLEHMHINEEFENMWIEMNKYCN